MSTYTLTDQMWLSDVLNWEKTSTLITFDWSILSFLFQSSFLSQYFFLDHPTKISNLDIILIQSNIKVSHTNASQLLYDSLMYDSVILLNTQSLAISTLFQTEYQEPFNVILVIAPELVNAFTEYFLTYIMSSTLNFTPSVVFDAYTNNLNFFYGEGCVHFFLFFLYVYFIIYFFSTLILLKWANFSNSHFLRFYYFFYSLSKETRIQFEAVTQTMVFFLIY
jgi:hypothetical protein